VARVCQQGEGIGQQATYDLYYHEGSRNGERNRQGSQADAMPPPFWIRVNIPRVSVHNHILP
jgi:hypothetical protein